MRILIAEDNEHKYKAIEDFLLQEFPTAELKRFTYAKGIILELMSNEYEFLIQDMQMPLNSDGRIEIDAGKYVLEQLKYRGIEIKTIVCSSEDQTVPDEIGFVKFEYGKSNWKKELIKQMKNLK